MKNKSFAIILALLTLGLLQAATPLPTYACDCTGRAPAKQILESSDVVFLGKVISITDSAPPTRAEDHVPFTGRAVLFEVITIWKGKPKAQIIVHTASDGISCGVPFTVGETRVVFASEWDNQPLRTASCDYLRPEGAPPDEVALGVGTSIPTPISSAQQTTHFEEVKDAPSPEQPGVPTSFILLGTALIMLASVAVLIIRRQSA